MARIKLSDLGAYRELSLKLVKSGKFEPINPDDIIGAFSVRQDMGMITEFSVTVQDKGVDDDDVGTEYPRLDPMNVGTAQASIIFGYVGNPNPTKKMFVGRLKEMRPQFPVNKPPRVELVFQGSGWEMTRVRRRISYPHLAKKRLPEEDQQDQVEVDIPINPEPDRSWAEVEDINGEITLEDVIRGILEGYGYNIAQFELPDPNIKFTGKDPLEQEDQTDWMFLTELQEEYGFTLFSEIQTDSAASLSEVYSYHVVPNSKVKETEKKEVEFWYHINRGKKVTEYDPSSKSTFIILGEPDATINSNWMSAPSLEFRLGEDGTHSVSFTNPESGMIETWDIDLKKVEEDTAGANKYLVDYLAGKAGWEEAQPFFVRRMIDHNASDKSGLNRSRFQGVELGFQTVGNPLAEVGMVYPINGMGKFFSKRMVLTAITHTVDHRWMTNYEFKLME